MHPEHKKALERVNAAARPLWSGKRRTLPILTCCRIEGGRATWTDLETWVETDAPGAPDGVIPAGELSSWLEYGYTVEAQKKAEDFPIFEETANLEPDAVIPAPALAAVAAFASGDEKRPVLTGIMLEAAGERTRAVATDSYTLGKVETNGRAPSPGLSVLLPAASVKIAAKLAGKGTVEVHAGEKFTLLVVQVGALTVRIWAKNMPGQFPNWQQLFPKVERLCYSRIPAGYLAEITKKARQGNMMVRRDPGGLQYFIHDERGNVLGLDHFSDAADCSRPMDAGFNSAYLGRIAGLARAFGEGPKKAGQRMIAFGMDAEKPGGKPALAEMTDGDTEAAALIMPVRLR